jgi:tetratricopeptide (TPR) repeat protein
MSCFTRLGVYYILASAAAVFTLAGSAAAQGRRNVMVMPGTPISVITTPTLYAVQAAAFLNPEEAEVRRRELAALGLTPVWIQSTPTWQKVMVGAFDTYVDALVCKTDLESSKKAPGAFIQADVSLPASVAKGEPSAAFLDSIFRLKERPLELTVGRTFSNASCPIKEGGIRPALNGKVADSEAANDRTLVSGGANAAQLLERASRRAGQEGGLLVARELLKPVADGSVDASPAERYQAMWLLARVYHAAGWRLPSYRAYRELERDAQEDDLARVRCEAVGLLLEMAQSDKGTFGEVRRVALQTAATMPSSTPDQKKLRAVVELMALETFSFAQDHSSALRETDTFLTRYGSDAALKREVALVLLWKGQALAGLKRNSEAKTVYEAVLALNPTAPGDNFPGMRTDALALLFLGELAAKAGEPEAAQERLNALHARHAGCPELETLRKIVDEHKWARRAPDQTAETPSEGTVQ